MHSARRITQPQSTKEPSKDSFQGAVHTLRTCHAAGNPLRDRGEVVSHGKQPQEITAEPPASHVTHSRLIKFRACRQCEEVLIIRPHCI